MAPMISSAPALVVVLVLVLARFPPQCKGLQQQYFRVTPKNVRVHEGGEALLECEVGNLAGSVQWTKDGFALGFSPVIPGFPRYSMFGDNRHGVFNLRISNASLDDDAEFQCQVGPSGSSRAIRANSTLTVISPPSGIEIADHPSNSKIEIPENKELELECRVRESTPAATIVWYRANAELKLDKREDHTTEVAVPGNHKAKRYSVTSKIKLTPTAEDDFAEYACEARHEALPPDMPLRASVQLSVLYPPGAPYIEGYPEGETVRRGQNLELVCKSRGGNPPAQLIWYKNDAQIRMVYRTMNRVSVSELQFSADSSDNLARYRCDATNIMSVSPLSAHVDVTVKFAPNQVTISGATEARAGDHVPLTCTTANSNPAAEVKWQIDGETVPSANVTSRSTVASEGGWITTSNVTVLVPADKRTLVVICLGMNMQLTENAVSTLTINVQSPPGQPIIQGYTEGTNITAGVLQKISCISSGGNPLATITWYKNDKKINSVVKTSEKSVSAELAFYANMTDNGARYKCEAGNAATEIPLVETVTLSVLFAPDHVRITKEPATLKPGQRATLTCDSSSSNPPAVLTWWREGILVQGSTNTTRAPGLHGGTVSSIKLTLNVTSDLDSVRYTCQAKNELLDRSVSDAISLDVLYKPIVSELPSAPFVGVEGQPLVVALQATGNPTTLTYKWLRGGKTLPPDDPRFVVDGPVLNVTSLRREDAGPYTCEISNTEGGSIVDLNITVHYPAAVINTSEPVLVDSGKEARIWCAVDGVPLNEEHVSWRREGDPDLMKRASVEFRNNNATLVIKAARQEDSGAFKCLINNNLGNETSAPVYLLVKHKPEMDQSPQISKAASNPDEKARLICRATGAPLPKFSWSWKGAAIPINTTSKYVILFKTLDVMTTESVLIINNVDSTDFGQYECVARNELGFSTTSIRLDVTSPPDAPVSMTVLNATHDSVTLSWTPGFDGGLTPSYRIRYRRADSPSEGFRYVDVVAENATMFTVTGLQLDTEYVFSASAFNKLGISKYMPEGVKGSTTNEVPPSLQTAGNSGAAAGGWLVAVVAAVGTAIVLLNVLFVGCCVRRHARKRLTADLTLDGLVSKAELPRVILMAVAGSAAVLLILNAMVVFVIMYRKRQQKLREAASEQSSSKSATIEMYAPSSYNETVTGETLSSVSEKSETYSNGDSNPDYLEDGRKGAASTYLIDQIDYPFQYPGYELQHSHPHPHQHTLSHTLPHPHHHQLKPQHSDLAVTTGTLRRGVQPTGADSPYYTPSGDGRYVAYPPPAEFSQPTGNGTLVRGGSVTGVLVGGVGGVASVGTGPQPGLGVPPDVTVLHPPGAPPLLSTFSTMFPNSMETEGHLV